MSGIDGADIILLWQHTSDDELLKLKTKFRGKKLYRVATSQVEAKEFGQYLRIMWDACSLHQKNVVLDESKRLFREFLARTKKNKTVDEAVLIGTYPN